MKYITENIKDIEKIAKIFIDKLYVKQPARPLGGDLTQVKQATIVTLSGDLGAGKTTFVQSVAKILKIQKKVVSPTFVLMKRYPIGKTYVWENLYHIDAYRLEGKDIKKELQLLKFQDILNNPKNIIFIEWPEILGKNLPKKVLKIKIKHNGDNSRIFDF